MTEFIAIDLETTGLGPFGNPPRDDAILEVGLAWRDSGGRLRDWSSLVRPDARFLQDGWATEALAVNGISLTEVQRAPEEAEVAQELRTILGNISPDVLLVAYNREFDEYFLKSEPWALSTKLWGPCIQASARNVLFGRRRNLGGAMRKLGILVPESKRHRASSDALAALQVWDHVISTAGSLEAVVKAITSDAKLSDLRRNWRLRSLPRGRC